jgi:hypothetical protein
VPVLWYGLPPRESGRFESVDQTADAASRERNPPGEISRPKSISLCLPEFDQDVVPDQWEKALLSRKVSLDTVDRGPVRVEECTPVAYTYRQSSK